MLWRIFIKEFRKTFHTTGALLPSSQFLARAMVRPITQLPPPRRILEIGPGTGAFTNELLKVLGPQDHLDMVELNETFVDCLKDRFHNDPAWMRAEVPWNLLIQDILKADLKTGYNAIVSGLPFNNFPPELVQQIVERSLSLLQPGGVYSYFEYWGIRPIKVIFVNEDTRERIRAIDKILKNFGEVHESKQDLVFANIPPAVAHHLKTPS